jgi:hexosaminidase
MAVLEKNQFKKLLIPVKKVFFTKDFFHWSARPLIASSHNADYLPLEQLKSDLKKQALYARIISDTSEPVAVSIFRDKTIASDEGHRIKIDKNGIEIFSKTDSGAYYAVQTLRDLVAIYGRVLPCCIIEDEPDFRRRGVYHDCSRGKVPKLETLKELVERLAHWKINELQLYVENVFTFKKHPDIGKGFSPFTPQEILSLQDYCRLHHIRLVGSLSSFGHFEKILSLPKYTHLGEMPGFRGFAGGTTLCPIDAGSIKLLSELYIEFVPLFEAEDFNVCCDETWELGKGRSKRRAERIGAGNLYLEFLMKIYSLCQKYGKRMNLWADIVLHYPDLLKKLPKDLVLLNWEYEKDGPNIARTKDLADSGLTFMVCPGTSSWLSHGSRLYNSIANVSKFAAEGRKRDAEGLLNTDWGDSGHRNFLGVSLHSFAHGAAHSWNGKAVDDSKFTENFCFHVFGQKTNRLAETILLLGNSYRLCGKELPNKSPLYYALVEPLISKKKQELSYIDMTEVKGLQRIIRELSDNNLWPQLPESISSFEKLAIRELKLAALMDLLASQRAIAAKALRGGKNVRVSELLKLGRQMHKIGEDFRELWLMRNKPSRLNDNMRLFKQAENESYRLAGKR